VTASWPDYRSSADLAAIEAVPWDERGLPRSVYALLCDAAASRPAAVAHRTMADGSHWDACHERTYGQLLLEVRSAANVLHELGVGRRDVVGLLSVNTSELVPALLAAETVGIASPLNPSLAAHDVEALLRLSGARVLVAAGPELDAQIWERARDLAARLRLDALLALRPTGAAGAPPELARVPGVAVEHLSVLAARQQGATLLMDEPAPDDLAAFFHTGGTTGTPKLAAHTHRMQVVDAWSVAVGSVADPDAAFFAALPLFHVNALIVTTLAPMMRTQPVVWAGPLGFRDPALMRSFWHVVERYAVAGMSGVPTVYNALAQQPVDADISSLVLAIVGAAPLPAAVAQRWFERTGVPLCEGYGLTEATCASARSFPGEARAGYVGQRLPYQQVRAVRPDPQTGAVTVLPPGEVGTIQISGPVVFPGYVVGRRGGDVVLDAGGKVVDGWLDTGDLGAVGEDGWLRLVGRAKDVIIRGGHNIDPAPVEQVLLGHPEVADAGVVGRPDPRSGEVPMAFVVLRGADVDLDSVRAWAAERVPEPAAAPVHVVALPALPVTAVGKPDKVALRVLATRLRVGRALDEAGIEAGPPESWCRAVDGVVVVRLAVRDEAEAARAREVLAQFGLDWRVEVPQAAPTA